MLGWWADAAERVGYCINGRRPLLSIGLEPPSRKPQAPVISTVDYYLRLAEAVGCPEEIRRVELMVSQKDQRKCERAWRNLGLDRFSQVVLFNAANGSGDSRTWPPEYFADLARRIVRAPGIGVLILCGPGEQGLAADIERRADRPQVLSMANQDLSLGVAKACIRRADLLVTTDNGPRHLAAAFSTPTLLLAGPFDPRKNNNYNPYESTIRQTVECQPCNSLNCPLKHVRCMKELEPARVYQSVSRILAKPHRRAA
jgi:heptosyltransferase-2